MTANKALTVPTNRGGGSDLRWKHGLRAQRGDTPGRKVRVRGNADAAQLAELATTASSGCLYLASALQKHLPTGDAVNTEPYQRGVRFMSALARNGARLERLAAQLKAGKVTPAQLGDLPLEDYERLQKKHAVALSTVLTRLRVGYLWLRQAGSVEGGEGELIHARRAHEGMVVLSNAAADLVEDMGQALAWYERRAKPVEALAERMTRITLEGEAERQAERAALKVRKAAKK